MSAAEDRLVVGLSKEEKAQLAAEAEREGISMGLLAYRRIFDKPHATRRVGRPKKHSHDNPQEAGLFKLTG